MPNYRRFYLAHHPVFVTIVTNKRQKLFVDDARVNLLLEAMRHIKKKHAYLHYGHVIMPDHIHWMFECLENNNFSKVVSAVKREVTWRMKEHVGVGRQTFADKNYFMPTFPLWQKRFFDHVIRDECDFARHLDYIHFNPVKHEIVKCVADYPHSSFSEWTKRGVYTRDWGTVEPEIIKKLDYE
ncbi:MAG: transposase [Desulfobulbaceae bacterium]|nr:transposase [Desulfobulbaceae bacterium]